MDLRLTVVCNELPYPPIHGGRSDTWRRLCAFREAGVSVHLVAWYVKRAGRPCDADLRAVRDVANAVDLCVVSRGPVSLLRRAACLPVYPPHASSRIPRRGEWRKILRNADAFDPHAVWLDGLYGAAVASRLARRRDLPLFYRAHNVEHLYMRQQARASRSVTERIRLTLAAVGLRRCEQRILAASRRTYDISLDDIEHWRSHGFPGLAWLPPTLAPTAVPALGAPARFDVVFLGNLHTPNNVEAVRWLLREVMPRVHAVRPDVSICIAGSRPAAEIVSLCRGSGASLQADPPAPEAVYASARILVNPARSGSGVQIKTVEMLRAAVPVVCTSVGAQGLPAAVKAELRIADTPSDFAESILDLRERPAVDRQARAEALQVFSPDRVWQVVREIAALCGRAG